MRDARHWAHKSRNRSATQRRPRNACARTQPRAIRKPVRSRDRRFTSGAVQRHLRFRDVSGCVDGPCRSAAAGPRTRTSGVERASICIADERAAVHRQPREATGNGPPSMDLGHPVIPPPTARTSATVLDCLQAGALPAELTARASDRARQVARPSGGRAVVPFTAARGPGNTASSWLFRRPSLCASKIQTSSL
jgi:hypothetical protein